MLPPGLLQGVEFRSIEKFSENFGNLRFDDPGTVVLDRNAETVFRQLPDLNLESGQNSRFFAGVQRIVDCFFDGGQKRLLRIIKSQQVAVLAEKFGNRDFALAVCHAFRGFAASGTALGRGRRS